MTAFFWRETQVVAPDKPKMYIPRRQAFAPISMWFIVIMLKTAVYQTPTLYMFLVIGVSM